MRFNSTREIIDAYTHGEMVILMDDEQRENEGDLLAPASMITAQHINFMATHARGLICLTLTADHCDQLRLSSMSARQDDISNTHFTQSIEAKEGVTTGISAADRATTIQVAVNPFVQASDIVTPGHVFPLRSQQGGVLVRAGHTEAGCDLAMLAGMPCHASVIVEIMNADGSMARCSELMQFAEKHGICIGTIADLINYRLQHEPLIEQVNSVPMSGHLQGFDCYHFFDKIDHANHYALVLGEVTHAKEVSTRVQVQSYADDVLGSLTGFKLRQHRDGRWNLQAAIDYIKRQQAGVVVLLAADAQQPSYFDQRNFGKGAQILRLIGASKIKVLGTQANYAGISGFGIEVTQFIDPPV